MFFAPQRIPFLFLSIIIHASPLRAARASGNTQMRSVQATWQSIVEVEVIVRSVEPIAGAANTYTISIISINKYRTADRYFNPQGRKEGVDTASFRIR
jgi:hypothetical protein